jgi:tRNA (cmo5U34)-methyltransferase
MATKLDKKSSIEEIRQRFDHDVERFSNIETGQTATVDAPLAMELIAQAAFHSVQKIRRVLDIGCGAGNNTIKLSQYVSPFDCDLVDLSLPMLQRAQDRISKINPGSIRIFQGDFRVIDLPEQGYDVILAAAVLHHLRDDQDWESTFRKIYRLTAPGGCAWITDLVSHETEAVQEMMWKRYGEYLSSVGGESCKEVELLHKNSCFAAFGAIKS